MCIYVCAQSCLQVRQELKTVRQELLGDPALDLDDRVKRLRQAAYKYQYKQRQSGIRSCSIVSALTVT